MFYIRIKLWSDPAAQWLSFLCHPITGTIFARLTRETFNLTRESFNIIQEIEHSRTQKLNGLGCARLCKAVQGYARLCKAVFQFS